MSLVVSGLLPQLHEQTHFCVASDKGDEATRHRNLEATMRFTGSTHLIHGQRPRDPGDGTLPQGTTEKQALRQLQRGGADHDSIGLRETLQPGRNVWRLTQRQLFTPRATAYLSDDNLPCMDAYTDGDLDPVFLCQTGIKRCDSGDNVQPSVDSTLGIILMGVRIAKIDQ